MTNRHSIAIDAPVESLRRELTGWGVGGWWPRSCTMRYTPLDDGGGVRPGARFRQKVHAPFGPEWDAEVVSVGEGAVEWRFLGGMFRGGYRVEAVPAGGGCELVFTMEYELVGLMNRAAWALIGRRKHDENLRMILGAFKDFLESPHPLPLSRKGRGE